jgi:hypothetical protein
VDWSNAHRPNGRTIERPPLELETPNPKHIGTFAGTAS